MENETFDLSYSQAITFQQMDAVCKSISEQRSVVDSAKETLKLETEKLDNLEAKLMEMLKQVEKDSYKSPYGNFVIAHRTSVKIPQGEDKAKFFDYLKKRGIFDQMITVNSATLNAWYKEEFNAAKENGTLLDFNIDGLGEPTVTEILHFRKA